MICLGVEGGRQNLEILLLIVRPNDKETATCYCFLHAVRCYLDSLSGLYLLVVEIRSLVGVID